MENWEEKFRKELFSGFYWGSVDIENTIERIIKFVGETRQAAKEERDAQICSWHQIPIYPPEEGKLGRISCSSCGDCLVRIRGKHPKQPPREVCARCAIEILEDIYGNLYPNNQASQVLSRQQLQDNEK